MGVCPGHQLRDDGVSEVAARAGGAGYWGICCEGVVWEDDCGGEVPC